MKIKIIFANVGTGEIVREEILSDEEVKAVASDVVDITEFVVNAIKNKARQMIDFHVERSGLISKVTPLNKKLEIIKNTEIESAADRKVRQEKERKEKEELANG